MIPIRRLALDRRTLLRGAATCMALPWLEAMVPALGRMPSVPRRALFVFSPNGVHQQAWSVRGTGASTQLGETLEPLRRLQGRVTVFSGFAIDAGRAHGDGPGDHARAAATFLTCAHPRKRGDLHVGVSIDQQIAAAVGAATKFPSLEVGMERGAQAGECDSGYACAYSNNISWRTASSPVAKETAPKAVFARLFGDPDRQLDAAATARQRARTQSVLDAVHDDAKSLAGELGSGDRRKLEQYLQSVRELEQRLEHVEQPAAQAELPAGLMEVRQRHPERLALMYELLALAFASDSTRVATFMLGNGGSRRTYRWLDVNEEHHSLSHHGGKADKLASIARIDRFQMERFAAFLQRLTEHEEGDRDLLANSLVLFGSGIGDGNRHNHDNLPIVLAGEGGGMAVGRDHVEVAAQTPLADLHLAIGTAMGAPVGTFADSRQPLPLA